MGAIKKKRKHARCSLPDALVFDVNRYSMPWIVQGKRSFPLRHDHDTSHALDVWHSAENTSQLGVAGIFDIASKIFSSDNMPIKTFAHVQCTLHILQCNI